MRWHEASGWFSRSRLGAPSRSLYRCCEGHAGQMHLLYFWWAFSEMNLICGSSVHVETDDALNAELETLPDGSSEDARTRVQRRLHGWPWVATHPVAARGRASAWRCWFMPFRVLWTCARNRRSGRESSLRAAGLGSDWHRGERAVVDHGPFPCSQVPLVLPKGSTLAAIRWTV